MRAMTLNHGLESTAGPEGIVAFDDFRIDPAALELSRAGQPTGLAPAPVRALLLLARRSGELVTREELYEHLWPDGGVDAERALNAYIRQIRRTLGERGGEDRFLRTYPGRGYRFLRPLGVRAGRPTGGWLASPMKAAAGIAALVVTGGAALFGASGSSVRLADEAGVAALSPPARLAFLTGSHLLDAALPSRRGAAAPHFRDVTATQPDFAPAHSGLAESLIWAQDYSGAAASATTAIALDPRDARAHRALGTALLVEEWDWRAAERHLRRSVELDRSSAASRVALAFLLVSAERRREARAQLKAAADLAPASPVTIGDIGTLYLWLGDADRAVELCERALTVEPDATWATACVRQARASLGGANPEAPANPDATAADSDAAAEPVAAAADPDAATTAFGRAIALVETRRYEEALSALEAAADRREMGFVALRALPAFRPLRTHPRFEALEAKLFGRS